jgi:Zn-dependent protease with chaperone function
VARIGTRNYALTRLGRCPSTCAVAPPDASAWRLLPLLLVLFAVLALPLLGANHIGHAGPGSLWLLLALGATPLALAFVFRRLVWSAIGATRPDPGIESEIRASCDRVGFRPRKIRILRGRIGRRGIAFVSGLTLRFSTVGISEALLSELSLEELDAVIAHESAHAREHHVALKFVCLVGPIVLCQAWLAALPVGVGSSDLPLIVGVFGLPPLVGIVQAAVARRLEARADAYAEAVKGPEATIRALRKLQELNPRRRNLGRIGRLLAQHPRIEDRVNRIQESARLPDDVRLWSPPRQIAALGLILVVVGGGTVPAFAISWAHRPCGLVGPDLRAAATFRARYAVPAAPSAPQLRPLLPAEMAGFYAGQSGALSETDITSLFPSEPSWPQEMASNRFQLAYSIGWGPRGSTAPGDASFTTQVWQFATHRGALRFQVFMAHDMCGGRSTHFAIPVGGAVALGYWTRGGRWVEWITLVRGPRLFVDTASYESEPSSNAAAMALALYANAAAT